MKLHFDGGLHCEGNAILQIRPVAPLAYGVNACRNKLWRTTQRFDVASLSVLTDYNVQEDRTLEVFLFRQKGILRFDPPDNGFFHHLSWDLRMVFGIDSRR